LDSKRVEIAVRAAQHGQVNTAESMLVVLIDLVGMIWERAAREHRRRVLRVTIAWENDQKVKNVLYIHVTARTAAAGPC
jgi:hypothetical protein